MCGNGWSYQSEHTITHFWMAPIIFLACVLFLIKSIVTVKGNADVLSFLLTCYLSWGYSEMCGNGLSYQSVHTITHFWMAPKLYF